MRNPYSKLVAPVSYQGGKSQIASILISIMDPKGIFCDLCCGTGALSIELINKRHQPERIVMLDRGPWGLFWKSIGEGSFDISRFRDYCDRVPTSLSEIPLFMQKLTIGAKKEETPYVLPILQAGSFGGKPIWAEEVGNYWSYKHYGFHSHFDKNDRSKGGYLNPPMRPMTETLFTRIEAIAHKMKGITGFCEDIRYFRFPEDTTIYIDPPYQGTKGYGHGFDLSRVIRPGVFVSEEYPLSKKFWKITSSLDEGGAVGGIGKAEKTHRDEYLSLILES